MRGFVFGLFLFLTACAPTLNHPPAMPHLDENAGITEGEVEHLEPGDKITVTLDGAKVFGTYREQTKKSIELAYGDEDRHVTKDDIVAVNTNQARAGGTRGHEAALLTPIAVAGIIGGIAGTIGLTVSLVWLASGGPYSRVFR